jgi:hypothetical protein
MASNYDPTFANVVTGQSSTAATPPPPRRSPLDELFDDPDYAAADVEERRAVLRHVAQADPDYAQATQEEQRAFEEFAVTQIPLRKRSADVQRNAPLAAELYQPNVLKEGAAAVDAVVKPAMEPVVAPFREQWYEPMKERATQGVEMLKQGLGPDPGPQIAPDVLPPFANRALKTGLGALTAASAVAVPFENAAGQLGQLAGFTEEGSLPAIRGLGGLAGGAAISGALPGGVMRRIAEETIGIGQIEGPGADIAKAMDAARPGFEPLDATMQRVSAMESAERARDMMAARAAARQNRQAAGVVVRPEGDIVLPPQGAPPSAAGVLRREAGDVPLGPRGEELPVEGDVYIGPQHAPQATARPAPIDSEALPPRPAGIELPETARLAAEATHRRPAWLQRATERASADLAAEMRAAMSEAGAGVDPIRAARVAKQIAILGTGVVWDIGIKGVDSADAFRAAMLERFPDLEAVGVPDWEKIFNETRRLLDTTSPSITPEARSANYERGRAAGDDEWYDAYMSEFVEETRKMPRLVNEEDVPGASPETVQAYLHSARSPQTDVADAVEQQLDATFSGIVGQRVGGMVPGATEDALRTSFRNRPPKVDPFARTIAASAREAVGEAPGRAGMADLTEDELRAVAALPESLQRDARAVPPVIDRHMLGEAFGPERFADKKASADELAVATGLVKETARKAGYAPGAAPYKRAQAAIWGGYLRNKGGLETSAQPYAKTALDAIRRRGGAERFQKIAAERGVFDDMVEILNDPERGAFSYSIPEQRFLEPGEDLLLVSPYPERRLVLEGGERLTRSRLREYANANRDLLDRIEIPRTPDRPAMPLPPHFIGAWKNAEGKTFLDVSLGVPNASREQAEALGKIYDQQAVWDMKTMSEIPTGGTGEGLGSIPAREPDILKRAKDIGRGFTAEDLTEAAAGRERDFARKSARVAARAEKRMAKAAAQRAREAARAEKRAVRAAKHAVTTTKSQALVPRRVLTPETLEDMDWARLNRLRERAVARREAETIKMLDDEIARRRTGNQRLREEIGESYFADEADDFSDIDEYLPPPPKRTLADKAADARERLFKKHLAPGRASLRGSGSIYDTEDMRDLAVIGAYELLEAGQNVNAWRQAMLKQYPDLAPKLDDVLQGSKSYLGRIGAKQVAQLERSARPGAAASPAASIPPAKGMRPSPDVERVPIPVPTKLATKSLNEDVMRTIANRWQEQGGVWDEAAKKQYNQVSDKIAADIADGVVDLRDLADTLRDSGVSLEDFGRYVFKGSASEAGHKLNTLARVSRELDRLATDDEVLERALKDLDGVDDMLRDMDGIC